MKFIGVASLLVTLFVVGKPFFASAQTIHHCTGFSQISTGISEGQCQDGTCELDFPGQNIFSTVTCDDGQSFPVYANVQDVSFQQTCSSGEMSGNVEAFWSEIQWQGSCTKGQLYGWSSNVSDIVQYSGTCETDGPFMAQLQGDAFGITIECSY